MDYNVSVVAGAVLAFLFEWVPGLSGWFNGLAEYQKKWLMGLLLVGVVAVGFTVSCYGDQAIYTCDQAGFWDALGQLVAAVASNQGTHRLIKRTG